MIVLFTDFGLHGPYTGQMKAVLHRMAPGTPVIDLFADAPAGNPKASAYLLAAYAAWFPAGTVFLCVVDPGVGGTRPPVMLEADGRRYVGPGNGLFELVERRAGQTRRFDIDWKPERLSASFHGRDLFAPVAAMLARGEPPPGQPRNDVAQPEAGSSRASAGARRNLREPPAGRGLLVREFERARRNRRQSGARRPRARPCNRRSGRDRRLMRR